MEKKCGACGYVNRAARGTEVETCPKCGAWYRNSPLPRAREVGFAPTSRRRLAIWGGIIALAVAALIAVQEPEPEHGTGPVAVYSPPAARPTLRSVEYSVAGTASDVRVTYSNATGGQDQAVVTLPWRLAFDATPGRMLSITVQNQDAFGRFEVKIAVDGAVVQTARGDGGYAAAGASARL